MTAHELSPTSELHNRIPMFNNPFATTTGAVRLFVHASFATPEAHVCFDILEALMHLVVGAFFSSFGKHHLNLGLSFCLDFPHPHDLQSSRERGLHT